MADSSSKGLQVEENNGGGDTDRMSSLPDSVLLHILSFLPTKTCVATMSLVSRRWRHLWEHLQVFDFSDNYHRRSDYKSFKSFVFFVNSVLAIRRSRDIRKMHLDCGISFQDTFPTDSVGTWLRATAGPRLEELSLTISDCYEREFRCPYGIGMVLPPILFNCINLVSLRVRFWLRNSFKHLSETVVSRFRQQFCVSLQNFGGGAMPRGQHGNGEFDGGKD